jgi:hypothetical protein
MSNHNASHEESPFAYGSNRGIEENNKLNPASAYALVPFVYPELNSMPLGTFKPEWISSFTLFQGSAPHQELSPERLPISLIGGTKCFFFISQSFIYSMEFSL